MSHILLPIWCTWSRTPHTLHEETRVTDSSCCRATVKSVSAKSTVTGGDYGIKHNWTAPICKRWRGRAASGRHTSNCLKGSGSLCGGGDERGGYTSFIRSMVGVRMMSLIPMMFSCLKRSRILISLRVRWQYVWCSKGLIFLMATRTLFSRSWAALEHKQTQRLKERETEILHIGNRNREICVLLFLLYKVWMYAGSSAPVRHTGFWNPIKKSFICTGNNKPCLHAWDVWVSQTVRHREESIS